MEPVLPVHPDGGAPVAGERAALRLLRKHGAALGIGPVEVALSVHQEEYGLILI